jgi:hypothetical protein
MLAFVKSRSYSRNETELWMHEWKNPNTAQIPISDPRKFLDDLDYRNSGQVP